MDMLSSVTPEYATRYSTDKQGERFVTVPAVELNIDDYILVKPGEVLPADGILFDQCSTFDESLLSGEHTPILRTKGDQVLSGSINIEQAVSIRVNKQPENSTLSSILRLAQSSNQGKPRIAMLSEIVASRFVVGILCLASIVAIGGINADNASRVLDAGADLLAVSGAVFDQGDITLAAQTFTKFFQPCQ